MASACLQSSMRMQNKIMLHHHGAPSKMVSIAEIKCRRLLCAYMGYVARRLNRIIARKSCAHMVINRG